MNNKTLQTLIYNQLYSGAMYNYLARLTDNHDFREQLLSFKADSYNNARRLESIYEDENTSSYNPIIASPYDAGDFNSTVLWMIDYNGKSNKQYINQSYNDMNSLSLQKLCQYIMSTIYQHNDILTHMYLSNKKTPLL